MKSRNVLITLEKAREYYKSGNEGLKGIALQAFEEEEILAEKDYMRIKDFWDAVDVLGLNRDVIQGNLKRLEGDQWMTAIYKIDIIRTALNGKDWCPSLTNGDYYESFVRVYGSKDFIDDDEVLIGEFTTQGKKYYLVGDCGEFSSSDGLCCYDNDSGDGYSNPCIGFFGCKSKEIAQYMSLKFGKLIFEACYKGLYEWC